MSRQTYAYSPTIAIDRSIVTQEMVAYIGSLAELIGCATDAGYSVGQVVTTDGDIEVWGWTQTTPTNEQDWRVRVVSAAVVQS